MSPTVVAILILGALVVAGLVAIANRAQQPGDESMPEIDRERRVFVPDVEEQVELSPVQREEAQPVRVPRKPAARKKASAKKKPVAKRKPLTKKHR